MIDWLMREHLWVRSDDIILHNTDDPLELLVHPYSDIGYRVILGQVDVIETVNARVFDEPHGRWREFLRLHPGAIVMRWWGRTVWFYMREV